MKRLARDKWIIVPSGTTRVRLTKAGALQVGVPGSSRANTVNPAFRKTMKAAKKRASVSRARWGTDYGDIDRDQVLADKRWARLRKQARRGLRKQARRQ